MSYGIKLTADLVASYVSNNPIPASELAALLHSVHVTVAALSSNEAPPPKIAMLKPAISVKKTVTRNFIICLEDGRKFKSLKRHLKSHYNLSPEAYRSKWSLPPDYPMVAPAYSEKRSQLAKQIGLGVPRKGPKR